MVTISLTDAEIGECRRLPAVVFTLSMMITQPIQPAPLFRLLRMGVALGMVCLLLGLAPFAVAQDVHHELAAADTDGHEHSDNDLCQWVQHHTAGAIDFDVPRLAVCELVWHQELPAESVLLSTHLLFVGPSRAPPSI